MTKIVAAMMVMAAALSARGEDVRKFGDSGEFVPSGSLSFLYTSSQTAFILIPNLQYFVGRNLAIGLGFIYEHSSFSGQPSFETYGISPSIGYNFRFADTVSLFPQFAFAARHLDRPFAGSSESTLLAFDFFAPLLFHPVPHFFMGIGPTFQSMGPPGACCWTQLFVIQTVIGGWL